MTTTTTSKTENKTENKSTKTPKVKAAIIEHITLALTEVDVDRSDNSRTRVSTAKIKELAASIKEKGLLEAPIVQRRDGKYFLVAGYQRFDALSLAGFTSATFGVIGGDRRDALLINYIENDVREDLTPPEQAKALHRMIHELKYKIDDVVDQCGKSRKHAANLVRLRDKLDPKCWEIFEQGRKPAKGEGVQLWDLAHWLKVCAQPAKDQMAFHEAYVADDGTPKHPGGKVDKPTATATGEAEPTEEATEQEPTAKQQAKLDAEADERAFKAIVKACQKWLTWADKEGHKEHGRVDEAYVDGARQMFNTCVLRIEAGGDILSNYPVGEE